MAPAMPATLSSITRQFSGAARIRSAANKNRSGAGLPWRTCTAEKICGANRSYKPVRLRLALIFSGGPLDATQTGCAIRARVTDMRRGLQRRRKQSENLGVCLGGEVVRQAASELGLNLDRRLTHRAAEKPFEHLFRRDRITVTR